MPALIHASCPDCKFEWDAQTQFEYIGDTSGSHPSVSYFCPDCRTNLSIATDLDRIAWRNWLRGNQDGIADCPIVAHAVALIAKIADRTRGYMLPLDSLWPLLWCPGCNRRLVTGSIGDDPTECPNCHQRNARFEDCCHSLVVVCRVRYEGESKP